MHVGLHHKAASFGLDSQKEKKNSGAGCEVKSNFRKSWRSSQGLSAAQAQELASTRHQGYGPSSREATGQEAGLVKVDVD